MSKFNPDGKHDRYVQWTTGKEHKFLDGLGIWNPDLRRDRLSLLKKYLKAAKNRHNWDEIDKIDIINRLKSEIGG